MNPDDYAALLSDWISDSPLAEIDEYYVFARGAFGDLCIWGAHNCQANFVRPIFNFSPGTKSDLCEKSRSPQASIEAEIFTIIEYGYGMFDVQDENESGLFDRALAKLGPLSKNEIYAFEPALILGGEAELSSLRKVRLDVQLGILKELSGPLRLPFFDVDTNNL